MRRAALAYFSERLRLVRARANPPPCVGVTAPRRADPTRARGASVLARPELDAPAPSAFARARPGGMAHACGDGEASATLTPGAVVGNGRYTVGGEINRGGTAVVYEGFDQAIGMRVALKVRRGARARRG